MLVNVYGALCVGIEALKVTVEVNITRGIGIHLVGLADTAVKESLLRTVTALQSLGYKIPGKKIVINLAPADLRKNGSGYDLPIALGIIAASEQEELADMGEYLIMGELGLDGSVRNIPGALPMTDFAIKNGFKGCILPEESALEAIELTDINIYAVKTFADVIRILSGRQECDDLLVWNTDRYLNSFEKVETDASGEYGFEDIIGQEAAKRAAEIAASGGHNLIFVGPPGSGKSSIAKAMAGILPDMSEEESLLVSKIYSIAGRGSGALGLIRQRPFRMPHYSASIAAIVGGGNAGSILPGEISLAHSGILFLDEFNQMPRSVIEALRGPLEDRKVTISRLKSKVEFPASFMLAAASNPCPCGYYGEGDRCVCSPSQRIAYLSKLSGPILDRIDIQVWLHPVPVGQIRSRQKGESSAEIAKRVVAARKIQQERFRDESISTNAEMVNRHIEKYCPLSEKCQNALLKIIEQAGMSMRAYFRIIKVARTIADMDDSPQIEIKHLMEASSYRFLDKMEK